MRLKVFPFILLTCVCFSFRIIPLRKDRNSSDARVILKLKIFNNEGLGYSDLSKDEVGISSTVIQVIKGDGFRIGDTMITWQTRYFSDSLGNKKKVKKVPVGKIVTVYLRERGTDEITTVDSTYHHMLGEYRVAREDNGDLTWEEFKEYKLIKCEYAEN
jgi:hypothetical protein